MSKWLNSFNLCTRDVLPGSNIKGMCLGFMRLTTATDYLWQLNKTIEVMRRMNQSLGPETDNYSPDQKYQANTVFFAYIH